jgi:hypothetical protein
MMRRVLLVATVALGVLTPAAYADSKNGIGWMKTILAPLDSPGPSVGAPLAANAFAVL